MRHHHFLEPHFQSERFQFRGDIFDRLLRLGRPAQARADVIRKMRHLAVGVIAREGGGPEFFQFRQSLRRIKNRRGRRGRRGRGRRLRGSRIRRRGAQCCGQQKKDPTANAVLENLRHAPLCQENAQAQSAPGARSGLAPSPVTRLSSLRPHAMPNDTLVSLDIPGVPKLRSGKVREVFDLGDTVLFVATDRLSAFDVILPDPIPDKGAVLNQISAFWFEKIDGGAKSFPDRGLRQISRSAAALSRATGGPFHDRAQDPAAPDRMRRARLPRRLRLERLPGHGRSLRPRSPARPALGGRIARADLHSFDQKRSRPRPQHRVGTMLRHDRPERWPKKCAT